MYKSERYYVPIHEKANLTLDEAEKIISVPSLGRVNSSVLTEHIHTIGMTLTASAISFTEKRLKS